MASGGSALGACSWAEPGSDEEAGEEHDQDGNQSQRVAAQDFPYHEEAPQMRMRAGMQAGRRGVVHGAWQGSGWVLSGVWDRVDVMVSCGLVSFGPFYPNIG